MGRVVRGRRGGMASAVAGEKKVVLMVLWVLGVLGVLRGVLGLFLMSGFLSSSFEVCSVPLLLTAALLLLVFLALP